MQVFFPYLVVSNVSGFIVAGFVTHAEALNFKQNGIVGQYSIRHQSIVKGAQNV